MHIGKPFGNKNQGYVLLETVIILMVIACICMLLNKIVINNYLKTEIIHTRDDIRTLSDVEENAILEAMIFFSNNSSENKKEINKPSADVSKIVIVIKGTLGMLIKVDNNGSHSHIKLECRSINTNGHSSIKLIPKVYRTDYIYNCNCKFQL